MKTLSILLAAAAFVPGIAAAQIHPVSATASSQFPGYEAAYAIDTGTNSENTDWAALGTGAGTTLDLDLGGAYLLTGASVIDRVTSGGPNGAFYGGTTDYTTSFSLSFYSDASFSGTPYATYTFDRPASTMGTEPRDFFTYDATLAGSPKVEYVRYTVLSNNPGNGNVGLSDISFTGSVPEPATWAMMLLGFGMIGLGLRARRGSVAGAAHA